MSIAVHRTDLPVAVFYNANSPDFPDGLYIRSDLVPTLEPDLAALSAVPNYHWIINGDRIEEMDQAAKDLVDAVRLNNHRDAEAAKIDIVEAVLRAISYVLVQRVLVLNEEVNRIKASDPIPGTLPETLTLDQFRDAVRAALDLLDGT